MSSQNRKQLNGEHKYNSEVPFPFLEISTALKNISNKKSLGNDGFTIEVLKGFLERHRILGSS